MNYIKNINTEEEENINLETEENIQYSFFERYNFKSHLIFYLNEEYALLFNKYKVFFLHDFDELFAVNWTIHNFYIVV